MFHFISSRWMVVVIGFIALSLAFSVRATLGLMMPFWANEFGWSRSLISTGGAAALILMAAVAPIVGNVSDRLGSRWPLISGMAFIALGAASLSIMSVEWQFFLAFSGVAALGFGAVAMHVVVTAVAPLFESNRGLATGAATAGATAGQLLIIPIFASVLTRIGWRATYIVLGAICAIVAAVLFILLPASRKDAIAAPIAKVDKERSPISYLIRSPTFHALFWSFSICGFTTTGVVETHLLPYATLCGFPPLAGAGAYGILSMFNMIGMILAGHWSDKINRPFLLSAIYFFRAASLLILMYIVQDLPTLFAFAIAFGLFDYSTVPVTASLVASHLGIRVMGLTMGTLAAGHALGAAAGAFLGGYFFDLFARYTEMWGLAVALSAMAGAIALTIREHRSCKDDEYSFTNPDQSREDLSTAQ